MTLPTPGVSLSLSQIQGEFGGANPISMSEYYAGGAYVPAGTTGSNGAVPANGTISISQFYGTTAVTIDFLDEFISATAFFSAQAGYQIVGTTFGGLDAGNTYQIINSSFPYSPYQWITPTSQAANYEVYAILAGGDTLASGTLNAWVAVSGNPAWTLESIGSNVYKTSYLNFQVRKIGTTTVLDTWTVELYAGAD
jgi:hypothetical protein